MSRHIWKLRKEYRRDEADERHSVLLAVTLHVHQPVYSHDDSNPSGTTLHADLPASKVISLLFHLHHLGLHPPHRRSRSVQHRRTTTTSSSWRGHGRRGRNRRREPEFWGVERGNRSWLVGRDSRKAQGRRLPVLSRVVGYERSVVDLQRGRRFIRRDGGQDRKRAGVPSKGRGPTLLRLHS